MIRISVVTITYNAAKVLERTLGSVLAQTHRAIEHIIVDGASTDGTADMARRYKAENDAAGTGHSVAVVSEPDHGLYDAMNKGLRMATGDYVVFMNAGDCYPGSGTVAAIAAAAEAGRTAGGQLPAVIYGDTDITDGEGRYLHPRRLRPPKRLTWRSFMRGMLVCHQAFYARTDIARATEYDLQYRFSADVDWCIRIMKEAAARRLPLTNARATVANYMEEGQTTMNHRASLKERYRVMAAHYGHAATLAMHCAFVVRAVLKR